MPVITCLSAETRMSCSCAFVILILQAEHMKILSIFDKFGLRERERERERESAKAYISFTLVSLFEGELRKTAELGQKPKIYIKVRKKGSTWLAGLHAAYSLIHRPLFAVASCNLLFYYMTLGAHRQMKTFSKWVP